MTHLLLITIMLFFPLWLETMTEHKSHSATSSPILVERGDSAQSGTIDL